MIGTYDRTYDRAASAALVALIFAQGCCGVAQGHGALA